MVSLPLIFAGIFAFVLSWGSAFLLEQVLSLPRLAGPGFAGGYIGGGFLGGGAGAFLGTKLRRGAAGVT